MSLAVFRVDKTNARTPGLLPDDPPQVLDGEQRVYGAEVGVTGSITRGWTIFAAYTYLDSEILKTNTACCQTYGRKRAPRTHRSTRSVLDGLPVPWSSTSAAACVSSTTAMATT